MIQDTRMEQDDFQLLWRVIEEDGWNPDIPEDQPRTVRGVFEGRNGRFWMYAKIPADIDLLLCYSRLPFDAPLERVPEVAKLVARLNYGLRVGNFELDVDSGLVRFKSSFDFRGIPLTRTVIMNVFLPCAYAMDRFLPAFQALIQEGDAVEGAMARLPADD